MGFGDFIKGIAGVAAPFIPVVGPAIGAIAGLMGSRQTNSAQDARQEDAQSFNATEAALSRDFNASEAEKQRVWSAGQAEKQMAYQERLSNTAYQRAMGDMRQAGLNPMLAYAQGGASVPSGAMGQASAASGPAASSPAPQQVRNNFAEAMASAQQFAQLDNIAAQTAKTQAETKNVETDTRQREADFIERDEHGNIALPKTYTAGEKEKRRELLHYEAKQVIERTYLTKEETELVKQELKNAIEQNRRIKAETRNTTANAVLNELAQAEAGANYRFHTNNPTLGEYGQGLKYLGSAVNSAARLRGMLPR